MSEREYSNVNTARRAAVSKAWASERGLVLEGKGTRDWTKSQQAEIVATGRCKGYEGHHKCTVKDNPSEAANKDNIQFLNRKEHMDAHNQNFKNDPHGRYDPESGKIVKYDKKIEPEPVKNLTNKMAESRKESAINKYDFMMKSKAEKAKENAAKRAKAYEKRTVEKSTYHTNGVKSSKALRAGKARASRSESGIRASKTSKSLSSDKAYTNSGRTSSVLSQGKSISSGRSVGVSSAHGKGTANSGHGSTGGTGGHGGHGSTGGTGGHGGHGSTGGHGGHGGHGK